VSPVHFIILCGLLFQSQTEFPQLATNQQTTLLCDELSQFIARVLSSDTIHQ
jgi:hypothetical protein